VRILLFSDNGFVQESFAALSRSRKYNFSIRAAAGFRQAVEAMEDACLIYLEVTDGSETLFRRLIGSLGDRTNVRLAVVDPHGRISDVAWLFHNGVVDYLGKDLFATGVSVKRIDSVMEYADALREANEEAQGPGSGQAVPVVADSWVLSGDSWDGIQSGEEYTFTFLYIELDVVEDWSKRSGRAHFDDLIAAFHRHVERVFAGLNGRVWMWSEYGGLLLFPFNGRQVDAIIACLKLILNRTITSAEQYPYNTLITYRMLLHIGNTTYQPFGRTGTVVSDSLNFIFHLAKHVDTPGTYCATETVWPFVPDGVRDLFRPAEPFEGVGVWRMRIPVTGT
jgi:hypothetical protein